MHRKFGLCRKNEDGEHPMFYGSQAGQSIYCRWCYPEKEWDNYCKEKFDCLYTEWILVVTVFFFPLMIFLHQMETVKNGKHIVCY